MGRYRFLLTGKWIASFFLCVALSLVCLYLAQWQMDRKLTLDHRNNLILQNYDAQPVAIEQLEGAFSVPLPDSQWQPVTVSGTYLEDEQVLVRNRPYNGLNGFEILVPFKTDSGQLIILNRGWLEAAFGDASRTAIDVPVPPSGQVTVTARLHTGEADTGRGAPAGQIPSINLPALAQQTGLDISTGGYGLVFAENPAPPSTPIVKDKPDLDTGPNLSYSVQWYVFAAGMYVIFIWSARQKVRNDELDAQVAAELEQYYSQFYDQSGNYIGEEDEDVIIRKMEMVDDMPSHMKSIVRPKPAKKRKYETDEEAEDRWLDQH